MHACICVGLYICIHTYALYTPMYASMHGQAYTCMHGWTCVCLYRCIHTYALYVQRALEENVDGSMLNAETWLCVKLLIHVYACFGADVYVDASVNLQDMFTYMYVYIHMSNYTCMDIYMSMLIHV